MTGIDLVHQQLREASGEPLGFSQADVEQTGPAIECRIQAEDAANQFFPSTGRVRAVREPSGPGIRIDGALEAGQPVTPYYDPMLAKLIVWAETREAAIRRMRRALGEYLVLGVKTTIPFHRWLMDHPPFQAGDMDTSYLERHWPPSDGLPDDRVELAALVAAISSHQGRASHRPVTTTSDGVEDRWVAFARRAGLRVP